LVTLCTVFLDMTLRVRAASKTLEQFTALSILKREKALPSFKKRCFEPVIPQWITSHKTVKFILILFDHQRRKCTVRKSVWEGHKAIISHRNWSSKYSYIRKTDNTANCTWCHYPKTEGALRSGLQLSNGLPTTLIQI